MKDLIPWQTAGVSVSLNKYSFFQGSAFLEIKKNPTCFLRKKKRFLFLKLIWKATGKKLQWLSSLRHICTDK